jgi:protein SCO1/2
MNKRNALQLIAGSMAVAALGVGLSACSETKQSFNAVDITGADYAKDFSLKDADGKVRTMADFKGKAVVLFFGYAQCPDVCPTTMTEMAQVKQQLGKDGDKLQVLFVTVDPARDTPEVMKAYMGAFDPNFVALIPTPDELVATPRTSRSTTRRSTARRPPAIRWTTRPRASSTTRRAGCGSTRATARACRRWWRT